MRIDELIPTDELCGPISDIDISTVSANHRICEEGCLLFLLRSVRFDTRALIPDFLAAEPSAIVCECPDDFPDTDIPIIGVHNARRAYAYACFNIAALGHSHMKFIGITGTNGKTTTATMISRILTRAGRICGFIGTGKIEINGQRITPDTYSMTTPDPDVLYPALRRMDDAGCDTVIMEVSSHALTLSKLDPIVFDIGIFTGLSHEHLDFHGSMDNYLSAKEKLIKTAKEVIINFDDPKGKLLYEKYEHKATGIGVVFRSDRNAVEIQSAGLGGIGYVYRGKSFLTRIKLPLPGIWNIYNSMLAFECAYKLNVPPLIIRQALSELAPIEGRCECIRDSITVIIDYAHTPHALENLLRAAAEERIGNRKMHTVFGCGGERDKEKRPIMAAIAERYSDTVTVTSDNPRGEDPDEIIRDTVSGFKGNGYTVIPDRSEAIRHAILAARDGDIIVVAGKGHEKYVCDKEGYHHFDEKEIIFTALKQRRDRG